MWTFLASKEGTNTKSTTPHRHLCHTCQSTRTILRIYKHDNPLMSRREPSGRYLIGGNDCRFLLIAHSKCWKPPSAFFSSLSTLIGRPAQLHNDSSVRHPRGLLQLRVQAQRSVGESDLRRIAHPAGWSHRVLRPGQLSAGRGLHGPADHVPNARSVEPDLLKHSDAVRSLIYYLTYNLPGWATNVNFFFCLFNTV